MYVSGYSGMDINVNTFRVFETAKPSILASLALAYSFSLYLCPFARLPSPPTLFFILQEGAEGGLGGFREIRVWLRLTVKQAGSCTCTCRHACHYLDRVQQVMSMARAVKAVYSHM